MQYDIVIRGGKVVDASRPPHYQVDVGIAWRAYHHRRQDHRQF
jgi:hypothetical protein